MEVILGKKAGFCPGVRNTVIKAKNIVQKNETTYCLGNLVHNPQVVENLEKMGMKVVENVKDVPENESLIIRAHGTKKDTYKLAEERNIQILDLTCPKLLTIHKQVEDYAKRGYYIILIAEKNHPETIGTYSFCGENSSIIENLEDINITVEDIIKKDIRNITIFAQTTFGVEKFDQYVNIIKIKIPKDSNLEINKTICDATRLRQIETKEIASKVELMIIIGGKKSSNTNKLYDISQRECSNVMFVETMEDLYLNYVKRFKKVGIMAGASTPEELINEVVELVKNTETENYMYENSR